MLSKGGDEEQGTGKSAGSNGSRETLKEKTCGEELLIIGKYIFIVLFVIQVSLLDPLFFFIPVINDQRNCVRLDHKLGTAVSVLRSLIDFFYVTYIIARVHKHFSVAGSSKDQDEDQHIKLRKFLFLVDFLAVLPLPQVVLLVIPTMRGSKFLNAMYLLRSVVLCQFVPRVSVAYLFIASHTFEEDPGKARFIFSPFLYMLGIEVIGALWYFLSIERLMECYKKACKKHVGCVNSFYCNDNVGDHTSLTGSCGKTEFEFGIFEKALKSRVTEITDFPKKFLYCLQWSLENLSGFGQNLETSTYFWENLFAFFMSVSGLVLFFIILGSLQAYLESRRRAQEKIKVRAIESMENWPLHDKLPDSLQQQIKKHLKYNWEKNTNDADIIFLGLPTELQKSIKGELCSKLVMEKENMFKYIDQNERDELFKNVKLKLFKEVDIIQQMGYEIKEMVIIVQGKLEAITEGKPIAYLGEGDICGEELISDVFVHDSSFALPDSTGTIKAITKVHALVLVAKQARYFLRNRYAYNRQKERRKLCFELPKKVKAFKDVDQNELDKLSECVELKLFNKGDFIEQEGNEIKAMVMIVQGELEADSSNREANPNTVLKSGDVCGEEVTWEVIYDWSYEFPNSSRTIKARNRVQALVLPANIVRYFICNLPIDLIGRIRRDLCLDLLKKGALFRNMDESALRMLCDHVMPKSYRRGDPIILQGQVIDTLILVVQGTMVVTEGTHNIKFLKDGDLCGEELVGRASQPELLSKPALSTRTIEAHTIVRALVLEAKHLDEIFWKNDPQQMSHS